MISLLKKKSIETKTKTRKVNKPKKNEYSRDYKKASKKEQQDAVFRRAGLPEELRQHMNEIPMHIREFYLS